MNNLPLFHFHPDVLAALKLTEQLYTTFTMAVKYQKTQLIPLFSSSAKHYYVVHHCSTWMVAEMTIILLLVYKSLLSNLQIIGMIKICFIVALISNLKV